MPFQQEVFRIFGRVAFIDLIVFQLELSAFVGVDGYNCWYAARDSFHFVVGFPGYLPIGIHNGFAFAYSENTDIARISQHIKDS